MNDLAIQVINISKTFKIEISKSLFSTIGKSNINQLKSIMALDKISFDVKKGEILGIIGVNGCGKTTLLRTIAGVYKPDTGSLIVKGRISPLLQLGVGFHGELDARENIILSGLLMGFSKSFIQNKVEDMIHFAELERFSNMKLKHYSTGMKARLGFATSMMIDPEVFLIDEILSVGDKNFRNKCYSSFKELKDRKKTILIATHNLGNLSEFADRVLLMNKGKIEKIGIPKEVINEYMKLRTSN